MKELIMFLDEANFSESKELEKRSRKVVEMTCEHLKLCEGRSWFTQFRHILYQLEKFFLEESSRDYMILEKLAHYFLLMEDLNHFENIGRTELYKDFSKTLFWPCK